MRVFRLTGGVDDRISKKVASGLELIKQRAEVTHPSVPSRFRQQTGSASDGQAVNLVGNATVTSFIDNHRAGKQGAGERDDRGFPLIEFRHQQWVWLRGLADMRRLLRRTQVNRAGTTESSSHYLCINRGGNPELSKQRGQHIQPLQ